MAVIKQSESGSGNYYQSCIKGSIAKALTPKADSVTIIRPYPQVAKDGSILPMVLSMTKEGPDISSIIMETCVVNTGNASKFSGLTRPRLSKPGEREYKVFDRPFDGSYIKLKHQLDKGKLTPDQHEIVSPLFNKVKGANGVGNQLMSQPRDTLIMQCAVLMLRGEDLSADPILNGTIFCSGTLMSSMAKCLAEAHANGIDVFSPDAGYTIVISGLPKDPSVGRQTAIYVVSLGEPMAVGEDTVRENYKPWDELLDYLTFDEQLAKFIECFGADVASICFPHDTARLTGTTQEPYAAAAAPAPVAPRPALAASGVKPILGKPTLGAKPAAAPAPAVTTKPTVLGSKPMTLGAKPAAAAAAPVTTPTEAELTAEYDALLAQQAEAQ